MPQFIAKLYNLDDNSHEPIKTKAVLSLSDITSFVISLSKENYRTWIMLESARIEESLARMGANDWLKVAIQFDPVHSHLKEAHKSFIIITQRADEPCGLAIDEYNGFTISGTHFSHRYIWNLWSCFVLVPWVILKFVAYSCCCYSEDMNPIRSFTKQYKEKFDSLSIV
jgi:hypothetical protein